MKSLPTDPAKISPEDMQTFIRLLPLIKQMSASLITGDAKTTGRKPPKLKAAKTNYLPRIEAEWKRMYPFS